jgi:Xaa-Pro aminopeptidase
VHYSGFENRKALILNRIRMHRIRNTFSFNLRNVSLILFFFMGAFLPKQSFSQQNFFDTDLLKPEFHEGRRTALRQIMPENSVAVIFSNPVRNRSNDVDFQYAPDPDLYYLTGLMEPHAVLLVFSSPVSIDGVPVYELLFVQDRDSLNEIWNGKRLGLDGAKTHLGINHVYNNKSFPAILPDFSSFDRILVKFPSDIRESKSSRTTLNSMVYLLKEHIEKSGKEASVPAMLKLMASLREIKLPEEIKLLQKAVDITVEGFAEVIRAIEPGITEYQAQAIVEFYFKHRGAEYPGYGSISGGGGNTCVLHYVTNRKTTQDGDLLLMDMGAEYHGYTADVTRTVPVNGKFSEEQLQIYNLVLEAQEAGIKACKAGNSFQEPGKVAMDIISNGLIKLGLINSPGEARKYFNHGTSHYLGLEVHDPGNYGPLKPGMVITVEPGIYIPKGSKCDKKWWDIGIRIEDDVLITDSEPFVMSGKLEKKAVDIEKLMQEKSLFNQVK